MKHILSFAIIIIAAALSVSCSVSTADRGENLADSITVVTVDSLLGNPEPFVNRQLVITGRCIHLCSDGNRKLFLVGQNDSLILCCEATSEIGGQFPKSFDGHEITVRGIFREQRIDEAAIQTLEQQHDVQVTSIEQDRGRDAAKKAELAPGSCKTELASRGQSHVTTFDERMADYRKRIAARSDTTAKQFITFYYLDAAAGHIAR